MFVRFEEFVVERERTLKNHQTAIFGSVLRLGVRVVRGECDEVREGTMTCQIDDTLDAVFESTIGRLIHVSPRFPIDRSGVFVRQRHIDRVWKSAKRSQPRRAREGVGVVV